MKTTVRIHLIIVAVIGINFFLDAETAAYLEMLGNVKQAKEWEKGALKNLDSAKFTVYTQENEIYQEAYSNWCGMCMIKLPVNRQFRIVVTKKGWVSKIITVDSRVTDKKLKRYRLPFEIDMFEYIPELDASVLQDPIAGVVYNEYLNCFDYNFEYTDEVNDRLKKLYSDYYHLRKKYKGQHINSVLASAGNNSISESKDSLFYQKDLLAAVTSSIETPQEVKNYEALNYNSNEVSYTDTVQNSGKLNIIYKIQVYSLKKPIEKRFTFNVQVREYRQSSHFNYTVGKYSNIEEARRELEVIRRKGFSDAFIVAFVNSQRVALNGTSIASITQ